MAGCITTKLISSLRNHNMFLLFQCTEYFRFSQEIFSYSSKLIMAPKKWPSSDIIQLPSLFLEIMESTFHMEPSPVYMAAIDIIALRFG